MKKKSANEGEEWMKIASAGKKWREKLWMKVEAQGSLKKKSKTEGSK